MKFCYARMSHHGIVIEMSNSENYKQVSSNSISKRYATNDKLIAGHSTRFNMCLREPKIVLDKNDVDQYFKIKSNTDYTNTSYCRETTLEEENQFLVTSEKHVDHVRNRLSVKRVFPNKNELVKEKEVVLEGSIFSHNNNFFHNINEYIAQQSLQIDSSQSFSNTQFLDNHVYSSNKCVSGDDHDYINNEYTMFIKGEPVDMECGDDILYTNGNNYYIENAVSTKTEPVEMECGDDILFTNGINNYNEDPVTASVDSIEMECGDDILFTNGAGYYDSDVDSVEGNQDFNYSYKDAQTNALNDEFEHKVDVKNVKSAITRVFEEEEDKFYCDKKCDFIKEELDVSSENSNFLNGNVLIICEKCNRTFENVSLLKKHQFESCGLKYFYTCTFCPSTSWYSSTLKNHIEIVHSEKLANGNIDNIMETIKRSKQLESDQSEELNFNKQVLLIQARQKTTKKFVKKGAKSRKKKIYIHHNEIKQILKISCFECNKDPEYVRGKSEPYCSQCRNEYTFQCRKCSRFYFKYNSALMHAKGDCKKKISNTPLANNQQVKKEKEKSANTLPNKPGPSKLFKIFCVACNQEQNDCNTVAACRNCNQTSLRFQCDTCKQLFEVETAAKRHSQACHRKWRQFLINSSLSTIALLDHNYYCKNRSESRVSNTVNQMQQSQFTELRLSQHKPDRKVYTGKKSQSIQL